MDWNNVWETVIAAVIVGVPALAYRWIQYKRQENTLHELAELRTAGVDLRNEGEEKNLSVGGADFEDWSSRIQTWKDDLMAKAEDFSPVEAERLTTLDRMRLGDYPTINATQAHILNDTNETLKRLDRMLEKRFRPTHAP